jgi:hypothetical protein
MASDAGSRPTGSHMVGIGGPREVSRVTGVAIGWRPREDIIDVAAGAGHRGMGASQREWCAVVVEDRTSPRCRRVAGRTGCRETCRNVIGIGGSCEISLVTGVAVGGHSRIVIRNVAKCAGDCRVRARERERCVVVIERGRIPRRR